jgi:hypothetical protein
LSGSLRPSRYCQLAANFNTNQVIIAGTTPAAFTATANVKKLRSRRPVNHGGVRLAETLELAKMVERNPIFDFVRDMATLFSSSEEARDEKPKGRQNTD